MNEINLIFQTAHRELKPRTPLPEILVEFFPFAGLHHTARLNHGRLTIRVSDIFNDAPAEVYKSLALILLAKLYRKKVDEQHHRTYRLFILSEEIQERAQQARHSRSRGPRLQGAQGRHTNLDGIFDRLNEKYFQGRLSKPKLSWSPRRSRYILGRYDATHHAIVISRVLDSPGVPPYVTEYVMFHEMLHVKHQSRVRDRRVLVHTPEFKAEEKTFQEYRPARQWLRNI